MKAPLLAISSVLALAVAGWGVKSALDGRRTADSSPKTAIRKPNPAGLPATGDSSADETKNRAVRASSRSPGNPVNQQSATTHAGTLSAPVRQPGPAVVSPSPSVDMPTSAGSLPATLSQTSAVSPGGMQTLVSPLAGLSNTAAGLSNENSSAPGAESSVLELEPGVSMPAALLDPEGDESPAAVAARQQIADSFLEEVDNALTKPTTSNDDVAVNESYYDSLRRANEQYRTLFGDEAHNRETSRAALESQGEK